MGGIRAWGLAGLAAALLGLSACGQQAEAGKTDHAGNVDQKRIENAAQDPDNWLAYGRTYDEQRFSPLTDVNDGNVAKLGLAFAVQLDTNRGQEATPIVVDGVMYFSTAWDHIYAVDAASGKVLWEHDPKVDGNKAVHACCDVVNRGVAVWKGKVYFGTIDGRLIALDAATGKQVWSVVTVDQKQPYTITGAPRVFKDKVVIGNSGAELGVRGYITAYDTETGKQVWRFYTVPGNPADGPDGAASDDAFAKFAGKTWYGKWWEMGGGGTVWDSMVYDPDFDQLIVGVGNGSPWNHRARSDGKGDNLFLSSILALNPDTGAYKWHYQVNPGESWDFTATQQITLADLKIDGKVRKVAMQAPKNGFFYVIDRSNGKLISAEPYVPQNWAEKIDIETGRPVEKPGIRYAKKPFMIYPSGLGAHAWMPMSYSPVTGLVYIPAMHAPLTLEDDVNYHRYPGRWNTGVKMIGTPKGQEKEARYRGWLIAWDPVKQKAAWKVERDWPWNGGTMATAGNLVFEGDNRGIFHAYDARDGKELWTFNAGRGVMAGPVTYRVNGVQYVAVLAGYGGSMGMASQSPWMPTPPPNGMLLAFKLGGTAKMPEEGPAPDLPYVTSDETFSDAQVAEGGKWYGQFCRICHAGPTNPDLFRSQLAKDANAWKSVVIDGALHDKGMVSFRDYLTPEQAESIRAYVLHEGARLKAAQAKGEPPPSRGR